MISIELTPRQEWLKKRVDECLMALSELNKQPNLSWDDYRVQAKGLASELLYATSEWDKYY